MDSATTVTSAILGMCGILIGIAIFFLKNLIATVYKQAEDISKLREDIAVLKFAILGYIKKPSGASEATKDE